MAASITPVERTYSSSMCLASAPMRRYLVSASTTLYRSRKSSHPWTRFFSFSIGVHSTCSCRLHTHMIQVSGGTPSQPLYLAINVSCLGYTNDIFHTLPRQGTEHRKNHFQPDPKPACPHSRSWLCLLRGRPRRKRRDVWTLFLWISAYYRWLGR